MPMKYIICQGLPFILFSFKYTVTLRNIAWRVSYECDQIVMAPCWLVQELVMEIFALLFWAWARVFSHCELGQHVLPNGLNEHGKTR